jgi:transposase
MTGRPCLWMLQRRACRRKVVGRKRGMRGKSEAHEALLRQVNLHAAGIDVGSERHYVAVPKERDAESVRSFGSVTGELNRLADWLKACGIQTVAMESTGVYWIPLYELLEERGFEVVLVNARHLKNVPGRKTDVLDCQWLQRLHTFGLLQASFRPAAEIAQLRAYVRHREMLVRYAASHVQHMQKALTLMNLQLHQVISDLTGETGMRILRRLVAGEPDPQQLAQERHPRIRASQEEIAQALTGTYRPEYLFQLRQALELYDHYQTQITACDRELEQRLAELAAARPEPSSPLSTERRRKPSGNEPHFELRPLLYRIAGGDLSEVDGIGVYAALRLLSETGTDMNRWPTVKHFTSWLCLAPRNQISGGKVLRRGTPTSSSRAALILRIAAMAAGKTQTALGAFYRRLAARIGKAKAITATARKIAERFYQLLATGQPYRDPGAAAYTLQQRERILRSLRRRAASLGFQLQPIEAVAVTVS